MAKKKLHKSTIARARSIKAVSDRHYEPGNQSRCYKAVWRRWIYPEFGVSYWTYLRLMGLEPCIGEREDSHPSLFD